MLQQSTLSIFNYSQKDETLFRRFLKHFDWILFLDTLMLSTLGLIMVYSATSRFGNPANFLGKQLASFTVGMGLMFICATINYQIFSQYPKIIMGVSVFFLIAVLGVGTTFHGTKAWLKLGPLFFQPSEISKLLVILILAGWCDKHQKELRNAGGLIIPIIIVFFHVGLILLQPDFGSTLVYFPILVSILYAAGASTLYILVAILFGMVSSILILLNITLSLSYAYLETHPTGSYFFKAMSFGKEMLVVFITVALLLFVIGWFLKQMRFRISSLYFIMVFAIFSSSWVASSVFTSRIKDYQRKRLIVFFQPGVDPLGSGYHVIQSEVALGSGKIFGKGLFSGTQGRLGFLPEQHTDFIFSVLGEELGFIVSGFVVLMYFVIIWRAFTIANESRDRFGSLVAVGIGIMLFFYIMLNLMMVMGFAPVTGLPLPLFSYGGSSLVSALASIGILLSIHIRRYAHG